MEKGEITKDGFLSLNVMEAEDNDGDTEDLWITLNSMGYNKALQLDEVSLPELANLPVIVDFNKSEIIFPVLASGTYIFFISPKKCVLALYFLSESKNIVSFF